MKNFNVPTRDQVSAGNQAIFDNLQKGIGFVPNLYAAFAYNETALGDFLTFSGRKGTLSGKEQEVINLVVSQINGCQYCKSAHTAIGKMNGFTDEQILEIRGGSVSFDSKLNALAQFVQSISLNNSKPEASAVEALYAAGYNEVNLADIILTIGAITITNYFHGATQVPVDFPLAPALETVAA